MDDVIAWKELKVCRDFLFFSRYIWCLPWSITVHTHALQNEIYLFYTSKVLWIVREKMFCCSVTSSVMYTPMNQWNGVNDIIRYWTNTVSITCTCTKICEAQYFLLLCPFALDANFTLPDILRSDKSPNKTWKISLWLCFEPRLHDTS